MCHLTALPPLDEVIAAMKEEEIRQKVMAMGTPSAARSALAVPNTPMVDNRECYNCGKKGHLSWNCLLSWNAGRGRTERRRGTLRVAATEEETKTAQEEQGLQTWQLGVRNHGISCI